MSKYENKEIRLTLKKKAIRNPNDTAQSVQPNVDNFETFALERIGKTFII